MSHMEKMVNMRVVYKIHVSSFLASQIFGTNYTNGWFYSRHHVKYEIIHSVIKL